MEKILHLTNKIEQIEKLAPFVQELKDALNLPAEVVFSLNLVLEEAVTNAILYAYPDATNRPIEVKVVGGESELTLQLTDQGVPFDPTKDAPEADTTSAIEDRQIGGLGIFLIRQMMDRVEYQRVNGSNILTMVKNIH